MCKRIYYTPEVWKITGRTREKNPTLHTGTKRAKRNHRFIVDLALSPFQEHRCLLCFSGLCVGHVVKFCTLFCLPLFVVVFVFHCSIFSSNYLIAIFKRCSYWLCWSHHFKSFTVATKTWVTSMEYLCHKWPRIISICRSHRIYN
jgi:hypothetical protein